MANGKSIKQVSQRVIQVELIDSIKNIDYIVNSGGLAEIQFSYTHTIGGLGKASIIIYNLNPNIVKDFTTRDFYPQEKKTIKVFVGYKEEGKNPQLVYTGEILFAKLTQGRPDTIFSIEAMEVFSALNTEIDMSNVEISDDSTNLSVIIDILESAGFTVKYDSIQEGLLNSKTASVFDKYIANCEEGYFFSGKVSTFLTAELKRFSGMQFLQDGMIITLLPNSLDQQLLLQNTSGLVSKLKNEGRVISAEGSGNLAQMIGLPSPSYYGVSLRTLYPKDRERILAGDLFLLQSRVFANNPNLEILDGDYNIPYQIISIKYSLQLRGQNFYQDIEAIRYINNSSSSKNTTSLSSSTKENIATNPPKTNAKVAKAVATAMIEGLQNRAPVVVTAVDTTNYAVNVKLAIKKITSTIQSDQRASIEYQEVKGIPIRVPMANNLIVIMPVQVGDRGWLVSSDMDTPAWRKSKDYPAYPVEPNSWRDHQFSWGYFEPEMISPKGITITNGGTNSLCLQTIDGKTGIAISNNGNIIINSTSLTINSNVKINGTLTNGSVNMTTHVHTQTDPVANVSQPHN